MKIVYEHLLEFLVDKPSKDDLSNKLFQLGHEHEIEGSIFDMEFTPNRGDCLSLLGLARDLNVFYETNLTRPCFNHEIPPLDLNFTNEAEDKCPKISFLNIEISTQVSEYKDYLKNYFIDLDINKNNFFSDVSNYIAYEMGQPTHSYDFDSLGNEITLKENLEKVEFNTLLNKNINLEAKDLVFSSKNKIINLSGIMGGMDTACSDKTMNALIECAFFKPDAIIGKSLKYNIHSDAAHKFERGTDPNCHENVLRRFIQIVSDHANVVNLELYTYCSKASKRVELEFNLNKVNKILGLDISEKYYKNALSRLGFKINNLISIPSYRSDINHQNDLAEEVARTIGYDNIPTSTIKLNKKTKKIHFSNEQRIKEFFVDNGFAEVINSPFCSDDDLEAIKVDNPLDSNRQYIRTNIVNSLIDNLIYNENRQKDSIKLFEISNIYDSSGNMYDKRLALIVSGRRGLNCQDFSKKLDEKYLKSLFRLINIEINEQITIIDRNKLSSKIKTPIFAIEINMSHFLNNFIDDIYVKKPLTNFIKYLPISEFPSSYRDLSFAIKDSSKIEDVVRILSNSKSNIIKNSFMFDFYENKKINESKIGFRFIFQSSEKTLTDIEIDNEINKIIDNALSVQSVSLPGKS